MPGRQCELTEQDLAKETGLVINEILKCQYVCKWPGCGRNFAAKDQFACHLVEVHANERAAERTRTTMAPSAEGWAAIFQQIIAAANADSIVPELQFTLGLGRKEPRARMNIPLCAVQALKKCTDFEEIRIHYFDVNVALLLRESAHLLREVNIRLCNSNKVASIRATLSTLRWLTSSLQRHDGIRSLQMPFNYFVHGNYDNANIKSPVDAERGALQYWLDWLFIPRPNGGPKLMDVQSVPYPFLVAFVEAAKQRFAAKTAPAHFCIKMQSYAHVSIRSASTLDAKIAHLGDQLAISQIGGSSLFVQIQLNCAPVGQTFDGWSLKSAKASKQALVLDVKQFEEVVDLGEPNTTTAAGTGNGPQQQMDDCARGDEEIVFVEDVMRNKWFVRMGALKTEPTTTVGAQQEEEGPVEGVPIKEEPLVRNEENTENGGVAPPSKKVKREKTNEARN